MNNLTSPQLGQKSKALTQVGAFSIPFLRKGGLWGGNDSNHSNAPKQGKTIKQYLSDRLDYGKNSDKTDSGELITSFACDSDTADAEFALSKREYFLLTGWKQHSDVIAYQVRQSFKHGEITPEEANKMGY